MLLVEGKTILTNRSVEPASFLLLCDWPFVALLTNGKQSPPIETHTITIDRHDVVADGCRRDHAVVEAHLTQRM
jgi:hypothetical protein